jgi:hypothetical protein
MRRRTTPIKYSKGIDLNKFIFTVKTDNAGDSNDNQFRIPIATSNDNILIDWGDGTSELFTSASDRTHTYPSAGNYVITIQGLVTNWSTGNSGGDPQKIIEILQWGGFRLNTQAFNRCKTIFSATDPFIVWDKTTTLARSFRLMGGSNVNFDFGQLNTENITNMNTMFQATRFDTSLANWNILNLQTAGGFMSDNNSFSTTNYDATLISWNNQLQTAYPNGVGYPNFGVDISFHNTKCSSSGSIARQSLTDNFGWVIIDGGFNFAPALEFDGVDDFCNMPNLGFINSGNGDYTISIWFKTDNFNGTLIGSSTDFRGLRFISSTSIQLHFGSSRIFTVPEMSTDVWYHLLIENRNTAPFGTSLYLNGVESSTGRLVGTQTYSLADQLGQIQAGSSIFNGAIYEIVVWNNISLSQTQITDLYNDRLYIDPTTIIPSPNRWYKFNNNGNDDGSDGANLTLNNFIADPYIT